MSRGEWLQVTRRIYRLKGWPREELQKYFFQGKTPEQAVEIAVLRRRPHQRGLASWVRPLVGI